jgi:hypothetical protein
MRRVCATAVLLAMLTAAAAPVHRPRPGTAAAPNPGAESRCVVPDGWRAIKARRTRYVIFGEVHGTREAPAFVGATACGLAAKGERLLIAVEHLSTDDAALQAAWGLPHNRFAAALRERGWKGREDGVASEAMFALLVRLHLLKTQGRRIDVVAFNGSRDDAQRARFNALPGQGPHEAAQAENIRTAAEARRYDHILVLVGNHHARKEIATRGDTRYKPMAMQLGEPGAVTSLNMANAPGTMWNCLIRPGVELQPGKEPPAGAIDCGSHPAGGLADLARRPFVGLGAPPGGQPDTAYDGFFWVGSVSASPPAVPRR